MPPSPKRQKKAASPKSSSGALRVAFQGAAGAFSEIAGKNALSKRTDRSKGSVNVQTVGHQTFKQVFEAVENKEVDVGIVPLENTVSGTIKEVLDLLVQYENLSITAETCEIESLCICANKGVKLDQVTEVCSDAAHLDQCSHFLNQLKGDVRQLVAWDSAGACKNVKEGTSNATAAAIASVVAAKAHGLQILQENISNLGGLSTRYLIIGKSAATIPPAVQMKCSIAVLLRNEPMALMKLVAAFALRGMNITKLESQPACHVRNDMFSGRHFDYLFFVDFEPKDAASTNLLMENIAEFAQSVRNLGTYAKNMVLEDVSMTEMPWTAYI